MESEDDEDTDAILYANDQKSVGTQAKLLWIKRIKNQLHTAAIQKVHTGYDGKKIIFTLFLRLRPA